MKLFILKKKPDDDGIVRLVDDDFHYLVRVRRLAVGECFPALLPLDEESSLQAAAQQTVMVKILSIENGTLTGKCLPESQCLHEESCANNLPPIILFQALPKGDKMDLIVRQAAEAGVAEIVPFISEFSFAKRSSTANSAGKQKFSRWERIIKEARQQSGSKTATSICPAMTMKELIDYWNKLKAVQSCTESEALALLFHHQAVSRGLEKNSLHGYLNIVPKIVTLTIGPEGGFSEKEVSIFLKNSFLPITIGGTIFRTETAALFFTAAVRTLLLERDSWELNQVKKNSV